MDEDDGRRPETDVGSVSLQIRARLYLYHSIHFPSCEDVDQ